MSLIATTVDALAATPVGVERGRSDLPPGELREFFHGRGLLSITWE